MGKTLLAIVLLAIQSAPEARYDERGRMTSIFGLANQSEVQGCTLKTLRGSVSKVEFDNQRHITDFFIGTQKVYICPDHISPTDVRALPSLIHKGNALRVRVYFCGTSGAIVEADQIEAIR